MKVFYKWALVSSQWIISLIFFQVIAFAEEVPTPEKKRDILKLLEVSGLLAQMDYIKEGVTSPYSRMISLTYTEVPDAFWDEYNKLIGKEEMDMLMNPIILVYNKHMSHKAIQQLIKMFSTSFWEEWKLKMPAISKEAGLIGSQWTQKLSQSKIFQKKLDKLVEKYKLDEINSRLKNSPE